MSMTSNLCIFIGAVALVMLMHLSTVRCASDRDDDIKSSLQQLSASILDIYEDVATAPRGPALRSRLDDPNLGSKVRVLRETTSRRKDLLKDLIVRDPEAALKFMYNHEVLYNLRRFMSDVGETEPALENLVIAPQADFYVISASDDDLNNTDTREFSNLIERYVVVPANDDRPELQYKAFVYGAALEMQSSHNAHVVGLAVDEVLAIDDQRSRLFDFSAKMSPSMSSSMYTFGTKSVLFIRVDFNDRPGEPVSQSSMESVFTQCKTFFYENSYGKMTLGSWKITPTLRMPRSSGSYQSDPNALLRDATSAAQQAGFSTSQYSFYAVGFVMIYPGWAGKGFVGMPGIWYNGAFTFRTVAHELGHNLGLWHANFYISQESPAISFGGRGTVAEYGDISDIMGAGITLQNHFNLRNKIQIGWAPSSAVQTVTGSGSYTIYAHDDISADGKLRGLQIPYSNSINYLISFRSKLASGIYANKALDVHMTYSTYSSSNSTHMIDTTPTSGQGRLDAPISVGASFTGPGGSPKITFSSFSCSTTPCTATVAITVGGGRSYYYSPGSGSGGGGGGGAYTPPRPSQPSQPPRGGYPGGGYPGGEYPGQGYWSQ